MAHSLSGLLACLVPLLRAGAPGDSWSAKDLSAYVATINGLPQELYDPVERRVPGMLLSITGGPSALLRRLQRALGRLMPEPSKDIGWTLRELPPPRANATAAFYAVLTRVQDNIHSAALSSRFVYILVPGLLANMSPGYFRQALSRLRDLGLDARYLAVDSSTQASSAKNAARLRLALENVHRGAGGRQLVLIAHSKGLLDASLCMELYPGLRHMVRAVVSIQAPFAGAAIADDIAHSNEAAAEVLESVLARFGIGLSSVHELTYRHRRAVLADYGRTWGLGAREGLRIVSLASRAPRRLSYALAVTSLYIQKKHCADNDGLVCVEDAILPGSLAVVMDDADHGLPVLPSLPGARVRGPDVVEALVTVALTPDRELPLEPWRQAAE